MKLLRKIITANLKRLCASSKNGPTVLRELGMLTLSINVAASSISIIHLEFLNTSATVFSEMIAPLNKITRASRTVRRGDEQLQKFRQLQR